MNPVVQVPAATGSGRLARFWKRCDITTPIWVLIALFLILLITVPIAWVIARSLRDPGGGGITFAHYVTLLSTPRYLDAIWNTLVIGISVGVLAVLAGAAMGWLVARTDLPLRRLFRTVIMASFVTPPFLSAIAWTMLAGPNAGVINRLYRQITGSTSPLFNIYSLEGIILVLFLYVYSYTFILIANNLEQISSDQEEAAQILGASSFRVAATVTVPLVLPALLAGFILSFVHAIALFGVPAVLALPARMHTATTLIWSMFQFPPRTEVAAAIATPMLLGTAVLLWLQRRLLGRRGYATVLGKAVARQPVRLGVWKWPAVAFCSVMVLLAVGLPYYILVKAALSRAWARPLTMDNFTLNNFKFIFNFNATQVGMQNSLLLGVLAATGATLLGGLIAYIVRRGVFHKAGNVLEFLVTAPVAIPGIVLGVGLFLAYTQPPLVLYGTLGILLLAYITLELPFAYSQANTVFRSIHPELEEAARMAGATRLHALRDVVAPLARNGLIAAWCFVFIASIRELSASVLLFTASTRVLSVVIFDLYEEGLFNALSAMGVLLLAVTFIVVGIAQRLSGRDHLSRG